MLNKNINISLVGGEKVGKTTLIKRIKEGIFDKTYVKSCESKVTPIVYNTNYGNITFNIFDIYGADDGRVSTQNEKKKLLNESDALIFIFDNLSLNYFSYSTINKFKRNYPDKLLIVCFNKKNYEGEIRFDHLKYEMELIKNIKYLFDFGNTYFEISVKNNSNLDEPFLNIARILGEKKDLIFLKKETETTKQNIPEITKEQIITETTKEQIIIETTKEQIIPETTKEQIIPEIITEKKIELHILDKYFEKINNENEYYIKILENSIDKLKNKLDKLEKKIYKLKQMGTILNE